MSLSHFDEKSGIIPCLTSWGSWWQTVHEVHIEINLPKNTRSKDVKVKINPNLIECIVHGEPVIKSAYSPKDICICSSISLGKLFGTVHSDDSVWTIEDGCLLAIVMSKADYEKKETIWESLLHDGHYQPDPPTFVEMKKKIDLEKFQLENPGIDFSKATLSKNYDKTPGVPLNQQMS